MDSPVKPDDMQGPPVSVWPCHNQGGNQVLKKHESFIHNFCEVVGSGRILIGSIRFFVCFTGTMY